MLRSQNCARPYREPACSTVWPAGTCSKNHCATTTRLSVALMMRSNANTCVTDDDTRAPAKTTAIAPITAGDGSARRDASEAIHSAARHTRYAAVTHRNGCLLYTSDAADER